MPQHWLRSKSLKDHGFAVDAAQLDAVVAPSRLAVLAAPDLSALLTEEARLTKQLYRLAVQATGYGDFTRGKRGEHVDAANRFLDHGNYLAYGLGAPAYGRTRRKQQLDQQLGAFWQQPAHGFRYKLVFAEASLSRST